MIMSTFDYDKKKIRVAAGGERRRGERRVGSGGREEERTGRRNAVLWLLVRPMSLNIVRRAITYGSLRNLKCCRLRGEFRTPVSMK
ncbi:hypothetical protein JZ751_003311 [Albula glossodonta]|uniref:Uncharacterized protein n=1 Tax=Albula glossodonta TaxID=121402 RepID=A0A8T2N6N5_9TELE|nr:hypothetical protein JZ751_003311 [Albula glossodonta]